MDTKRGVNLGCGRVIMPRLRPEHHRLIPERLYTDVTIGWDNVDWNAAPGVNKVMDLFDYPWYGLESSAYDVAIAAHLVEHIPHYVIWEGKFTHRHPDFQDGWFAWFAELWRILKPGGLAYILFPYAWSNSGISDPTHTRYLTLASFNYLMPDDDSPFTYRARGAWAVDWAKTPFVPHELGHERVMRDAEAAGKPFEEGGDTESQAVWKLAQTNINAIVEFCLELEAVK